MRDFLLGGHKAKVAALEAVDSTVATGKLPKNWDAVEKLDQKLQRESYRAQTTMYSGFDVQTDKDVMELEE